jgi:hypothetical protein
MTSLLRRKRQIIVRSTTEATPTNSPRGCLGKKASVPLFFLFASCVALIGVAFSADEGSDTGNGEIQKVVYSTTKSSAKLKWLPYRSQPVNEEKDTSHTERVAGWTSPTQAKSSASYAVDNQSGDKKSVASADSVEQIDEPLTLPSGGSGSATASPKFTHMVSAGNGNSVNSKGPNSQYLTEQPSSAQSPDMPSTCPTVKDLKKISELTTNIAPSSGDLPYDCPWGGDEFQPRSWSPVTFAWTASGLCHKPLYFEDIQLERYGHSLGPWAQPFASGAHFFLTLPILPYKMGLELPNECMYSLGYYRPGSCAPYMLDPLPLSIRAGLFEAGAWVGGVAIIP